MAKLWKKVNGVWTEQAWKRIWKNIGGVWTVIHENITTDVFHVMTGTPRKYSRRSPVDGSLLASLDSTEYPYFYKVFADGMNVSGPLYSSQNVRDKNFSLLYTVTKNSNRGIRYSNDYIYRVKSDNTGIEVLQRSNGALVKTIPVSLAARTVAGTQYNAYEIYPNLKGSAFILELWRSSGEDDYYGYSVINEAGVQIGTSRALPVYFDARHVQPAIMSEDDVHTYIVSGTAYDTYKIIKRNESTGVIVWETNVATPGTTLLSSLGYNATDIYVADQAAQKLYRINATTGAFIRSISCPNVAFAYNIAVDPSGYVYITTYANTIRKYTANLDLVAEWTVAANESVVTANAVGLT